MQFWWRVQRSRFVARTRRLNTPALGADASAAPCARRSPVAGPSVVVLESRPGKWRARVTRVRRCRVDARARALGVVVAASTGPLSPGVRVVEVRPRPAAACLGGVVAGAATVGATGCGGAGARVCDGGVTQDGGLVGTRTSARAAPAAVPARVEIDESGAERARGLSVLVPGAKWVVDASLTRRPPVPQVAGYGPVMPASHRGSWYYPGYRPGRASGAPRLPRGWHRLSTRVLRELGGVPWLEYLEDMEQYGCVIGDEQQPALVVPNGASVARRPEAARQLVQDYLDKGWYARAHEHGVAPRVVMALHLVPKSGGRWRLIGDMSAGGENSVNERTKRLGLLEPPAPTHRYTRLRDVLRAVRRRRCRGEAVWFTKTDIDAAYSRCGVSVPSVPRQGMEVPGIGLVLGLRLLFGASGSPQGFVSWSDAVVWLMRHHGHELFAIVDDFLSLEASWTESLAAVQRLMYLLEQAGFPVSAAKAAEWGLPTKIMEFLGVTLDTLRWCYYLSAERRNAFGDLLRSVCRARRVPRRVVARVAGKMAWFGQVYPRTRPFASSWHAAAAAGRAARRPVSISRGMRRDAQWFLRLLAHAPLVPIVPPALHPLELFTDASLSGFGAWWGTIWMGGRWGRHDKRLSGGDIMVYEAATVVFFLLSLGERLRGQRITLRCDNQAVCGALYSWRSRQPVVARLLRRLAAFLVTTGVRLHVRWISTHDNYVADALSRQRPLTWFSVDGTAVHVSRTTRLALSWRQRSDWWKSMANEREME